MAGITKEELIDLIKNQVEESVGNVTDAQISEIEGAVERKFAEMANGITKKAFDATATKEDDDMKFKSLGEQLQAIYKAGIAGGETDIRLKAVSGMSEGVSSDGGFLLQPEYSNELLTIAHDKSLLFGKCKKVPIGPNSNSLVLNGIDEKSRGNGSRWGGIQVYWADEAGTATAKKPKFRQMTLKLKKLIGAAYATDELMQDTTALASVLSQAFSEEFAWKVDDGIIAGTGAGQMYGILNSPALISQAKETAQLADTVVFENIINMWNRMPAYLRAKAEWYVNQDVEPQLMQMFISAGLGGVPVYMPANGIVGAPPTGALMGRPVNAIEQCPALGDLGDIMLLALSEYLVIDKGSMGADTSIHVKFLEGEQTFRFTYRVDGQPLWHSAQTAAKGTTTRSPYVALAAR